MISFEGSQTLRTAAGALLLAAIAAPHPGFSQAALEHAALEHAALEHEIVEQIREAQSQDRYSPDLIDPLTALGLFYQEGGDHAQAIQVIEQALQVVRANYGLRSLDQAPLIRRWIYNEEARGDSSAAWALEQDLLTLVRRHPGDLRTVSILREVADKRMDVLGRYVGGEFPPQIVFGCYYESARRDNARDLRVDARGCQSGSRGAVVRSLLADAWRNYQDAIKVILHHGLYSSPELRDLEMELVLSSYRYGNYAVGKQSLRRLITYRAESSEPWLTRIDALIQMADWDFLYAGGAGAPRSQREVLEVYKQAYEQLREKGIADESIEQFFWPKIPVVLPAFLPNPLASDETRESTGYVDVAFDVTRYGESRRVEILDTTTNATDADKDRLVRLIKDSRFRPRLAGSEFADSSPIVVRYHLSQ